MTARRVIPLFPAPLDGLDPARRADAYAGWLAAGAAGLLAETAAVRLLAGHGTWLLHPWFTSRCIDIITGIPATITGIPGTGDGYRAVAGVRWHAAVSGLARQPASGTDKAVLRIAASIAAGIPVSLRDCLGSLDPAALRAVLHAIACASSGEAGEQLICRSRIEQDPPF